MPVSEVLKLLLIEDNPDDYDYHTRLLRTIPARDFICVQARSGAQALDCLKDRKFDCVLVDYSLPGMDGLDMLRHIALHHPHLPVIMLTGQGNETVAVEALRAGAIDYLPKSDLDQRRLAQAVDRAVHLASAGAHPAAEQICVLLVEDHPEDREYYRRALESLPYAEYRCLEAASGGLGLQLAESRAFNCVLLDHMLPDMTGLDVLEALRDRDPFLPVILLTGQGSEWLAVESIRRGAHDYLPKASLNPERLNHAIKAAIASAARQRELFEKDRELRATSTALRESEETFRTALEHAPIGMAIMLQQGNYVQVNKAFCDMLGYSAEELLARDFASITHPDDLPRDLESRASIRRGESRTYRAEKRYIRKDGGIVWVRVDVAAIPVAEGPPRYVIAQVQDITAFRESQLQREALIEQLRTRTEALTVSEETFRAAIEHAPIGMRISSLSGRMLRVNQAFCDMLGYRVDELIGKSGFAILHPDDAARDREGVGRLLRGEINVFVIDKRYIHKQGHSVWAQVHGTVVTNPDGSPRHLLSQVLDVTKLREAQAQREELIDRLRAKTEALEASELLFRTAMDEAPIGMKIVGLDGRFLRVNRAFCELLGFANQDMLTMDFQRLTHMEDLPRDLEGMRAMLAGEITTYETEKRYFHKDGHTVWCVVTGAMVKHPDGSPKHIISQVQDISKIKQAQQQREKLIEELITSNTELERFAYIASHDMQEPLRMITNFSQIIMDDYADRLDEEGKEYLHIVKDSGERMRDIVHDLLEYAKIGHKEAGLTLVDGALELSHILDNLKILIRDHQAVITYDKLPAFRGNPVQFMRLLQNLITNAIKYQPPGNRPMIHIGVADQELQWCISVKDNGIGIDERFTASIFQPFRRLHSWNDIPGTGIGLAVCKKIVENHGGAIWVESEPGKGSVFHFTLPKKSLTPARVQ